MSDPKDVDDTVGYGKPPTRSRFKPGNSGNPRGRPKGTANLKTDLTEELSEKIHVREGDRERSISKQRALIKTLVAKALKGDSRAAALLITLVLKHVEPDLPLKADQALSPRDQEILDDFLKRHSGQPSGSQKHVDAANAPENTESRDDK